MIKLTDTDKTLVVPAGLGNFGQSSGGGGGVSREEVYQISEEVTQSAITEYDIEIQVDLEDIREAVSGNTEAIGNLSDSLSAYTTDSELQHALQEYATTAQTQAISDSLANYATTAQTQGIAGDVAELSGATQAIEQSLADYATTADTASLSEAISGVSDALAGYATTATTEAITGQISGLSATTEVIEENLETVSGKTGEVYDEIFYEEEGETYSQIGDLWDAVDGKQDQLNFGSGLTSEDDTVKVLVGPGLEIEDTGEDFNPVRAKIGKGLEFDSNSAIGLNIGEGLGFSGDTLVVSGGTGGGIEKVSELPQDAEEGDMVWLEGGTFEGITILCAQSSAGYVFELDSNYYNIDGNEPTRRLGNFPMARWFAEPDNSDIKMRLRFTDDDYTILDVIDTSGTHSISGGTSAVETYEDVEFQMRDVLYVYQNGQWFRKNRIEWVYDADEAEDLIYDIYHSDKEFPLDDFVIRLDPEKRGDKREFVPYSTAYYGMDIQCTDSRGNHDWGQIKVFCYRFNFDGTLSDLVGEQWIKTESQINFPQFNDIELVVDISGNMSSENLGEFSILNAFNRFTLKYSDPNIQNNYCNGPLEYFYRKTENIGGEDKLVEYIGGSININGTKYRGTWHFNEWEWGVTVSPDTWTTV